MKYTQLIDELISRLSDLLHTQAHEIDAIKEKVNELESRRGDDYLERCLKR